uniref:Uncharacterized protein n=1 Tax=Helianthus annuus TaxID=4232 RepID=A0A251TWD7_HELAN
MIPQSEGKLRVDFKSRKKGLGFRQRKSYSTALFRLKVVEKHPVTLYSHYQSRGTCWALCLLVFPRWLGFTHNS